MLEGWLPTDCDVLLGSAPLSGMYQASEDVWEPETIGECFYTWYLEGNHEPAHPRLQCFELKPRSFIKLNLGMLKGVF